MPSRRARIRTDALPYELLSCGGGAAAAAAALPAARLRHPAARAIAAPAAPAAAVSVAAAAGDGAGARRARRRGVWGGRRPARGAAGLTPVHGGPVRWPAGLPHEPSQYPMEHLHLLGSAQGVVPQRSVKQCFRYEILGSEVNKINIRKYLSVLEQ